MTSQVKNRFKILSTYLGQDKAGQAMLKDLKDAVNVLRKKAAATTEAATDAEASRAAAVDRAKESDSALKDAQQELRQVWGEVRRLTQLVEAKPVKVGERASRIPSEMKSVVKQLRREMRHCPVNKRRLMLEGNAVSVFYRDQFAAGWSYPELWRVGASVAVLCSLVGPVVIDSKTRGRDFPKADRDGGVGQQVMQWFMKNIDPKATAETRLYEADGIQ